jgi:hypothetical protein
MSPLGSRAWINNRNIERGIGEIEMNADPKHKRGYDDVDRAKRRLGAPYIVAHAADSCSISHRRCLTMSPIDTMPTGRSRSTTGVCRTLFGHPLHDGDRVSASPQVATSRVMICVSRLVGAFVPNSANVRTTSRSDKMPMTRRSAPSTTRAPIRCSAKVAIATSKAAVGSIVTIPCLSWTE